MQTKTLSELEEQYDLEIPRIIETLKKEKAKRVLLQFPDGIKPYSTIILNELKKRTNNKIEFFIWLDSCFGACDIPLEADSSVDLVIQFGHSNWDYTKNIKII